MRSIRHLTPRYIWDRFADMRYQRRFPERPWLTPDANRILASYLRPEDVGFEFGSGRSTRWLAARVQHLTSIEHHEGWHAKVSEMLREGQVTNVTYLRLEEDGHAPDSPYATYLDGCPAEHADFVLVDGACRAVCALAARRVLKPGAMVIIDNVNRYLPSDSRAPQSRSVADGPRGPKWAEFHDAVQQWRRIWTTNGVTDTAFFFKPT